MAFGVIQRRTGELPMEVTGFVGRSAELRQLEGLLERARLVTVTGPGGVGKTRTALRAAARLRSRYAHGVCLVELTGLRDPELLTHTLSTCLGLPEQDSRDQLDVLVDHLREREILLVLDTCEHLVDACAMLADILLRETRAVTLLTTSRQPLDVPGEYTCPVPPLPVRDVDGAAGTGNAGAGAGGADAGDARGGGDAVELFEQRAAAVLPGFAVTGRNRADVVKLCRRLDGIPLALELAAVRLRAVPLGQLVDRLEDRFRLLTGGRRTALPRHQTLRTAIDWSYGLCDAQERLLWARLSVFAGSFDVAAAEEVCADAELPREEILETLIHLVDKSVVLREDDEEHGTRYRLLDTLREYGAERGELGPARLRHVERYAALAADFDARFLHDGQLARAHALRRDHADVRAALEYALALPGTATTAAALAGGLWGYWLATGRMTEGRYWQTRVLERFPAPCPERVRALSVRASLATFQRDLAAADADLSAAIELGPLDDVHAARAHAHLQLSLAAQHRFAEAATVAAEAERRMRALGDRTGLCVLYGTMAYGFQLAGEPAKCLAYCRLGHRILGERSGEHWLRGYLFFVSGMAHYARGAFEQSAEDVGRALRLKHELGDPAGTGYALSGLAWLAAADERYERTAWLQGAASARWISAGSRPRLTATMERYDQHVREVARAALGEERYALLRRRGADCPLEDTVAYALDEPRAASPRAAPRPRHAPADALTRREREVAALVSQGLSNRQIAERLVISKRTVDAHLEHILAKFGASSRTEIAARLAAEGH
ncbi:LuxR C-terminal-related transcriptional regulator [Streptomyces albiaxialis]|uniref:LuxR C-terminal-related transcriptional regulator n=1 Tax=Streptomyces albiaxialis TaxID=329523 RepID=A0ABN2WHJ6_9ACTN